MALLDRHIGEVGIPDLVLCEQKPQLREFFQYLRVMHVTRFGDSNGNAVSSYVSGPNL